MDYTRQMEIFDNSNFNQPIHIIGCGAIGSWVALSLARLGLAKHITLWDFDTVAEHNLPNQAFAHSDIGRPKVEALADEIKRITGEDVKIFNEKYLTQRISGYVFLMVDSMKERARITKRTFYQNNIKHVFDARMGLSIIRIYNLKNCNIDSINYYSSTLYSDEESEVSACGASTSVITSALSAAALVVRQLINVYNEEIVDAEISQEFLGNQIIAHC